MQDYTQKNEITARQNKTNVIIGAGVIAKLGEAMLKIAPVGAGVLLVSDEGIFDKLGIAVERILRRLQLNVQRDLTLVKSGLDKKILDAFCIAEGVRAVVSVGGGRAADAAKYIAFKHGLPVAIVATSSATISYILPSALVLDDGFTIKITTNLPDVFVGDYDIICTQSSSHLASGFGELASRIFSVFEYKFCCLLSGKPLCNNCLDELTSIADSVLTALKGYTKGVNGVVELLIENGERLCRLGGLAENDMIFCGADSSFSASISMLFGYEKREKKMWGENEFVLSRILAKVYRGILDSTDCFMPPPDNNKRLNALTEYYGVSQISAAKHVVNIISAEGLRLKLYRLNEYKQELYSAITEVDCLLEEAYKIFKRLYDDDGYSLINYIDSADAQLAIALAPDCMQQDTMLVLLKNMGYLEKYII